METNISVQLVDKLSKQKNFFLCISIIMGLSNLALSFKLASSDERIIMVPGINREFDISSKNVSTPYLEESAILFLSMLLDISKEDIEWKRSWVLKYTSNSDKHALKKIDETFKKAKEDFAHLITATHFTAKNLEVDAKNLTVIANGILNAKLGNNGFSAEPKSYILRFELQGTSLRLKEFGLITKEAE